MRDDRNHFSPADLNELEAILAGLNRPVTYLAGATDLMVEERRWKAAEYLINLASVTEIRHTLDIRQQGVLVGAALPLREIIRHPLLQQKLPILVHAGRQIGSVQIQNRATLGGNIANASPAGDTLPVLTVLDAEIWIGPRVAGEYTRLKLPEVMLGPGETMLHNNQYIAYIYIPFPEPENLLWYFRKVGQRYSLAISKLSLAVLGWKNNGRYHDIRICTGSVSPQIRRATATENLIRGKEINKDLLREAGEMLQKEMTPITDIRSTAVYRRHICRNLLLEALHVAG